MAKLPLIARLLLGLLFTASGIVGLFGLGPEPELEGKAAELMNGFLGSGYFWPLLKITEMVSGLMLLSAIGVPLALVILAPVSTNIVLFHLFLDPATIGIGIVIVVLHGYLGYAYRSSFSGVLTVRARPG